MHSASNLILTFLCFLSLLNFSSFSYIGLLISLNCLSVSVTSGQDSSFCHPFSASQAKAPMTSCMKEGAPSEGGARSLENRLIIASWWFNAWPPGGRNPGGHQEWQGATSHSESGGWSQPQQSIPSELVELPGRGVDSREARQPQDPAE